MSKLKNNSFIKKILKFGVVGGIAFVVDYSLLYIFTEYCGFPSLISAAISFIISLLINYILSIKWVFDVKKKQTSKEIILFIILSIVGLGINELVIFWGNELDIHYMISKLVATIIVMIYNFITRLKLIEK